MSLMQTTTLSVPAKIGVSVMVGIGSLAASFATTVAALGQIKRLDYGNGIAALTACGIAASALSVMCVFGPLHSYMTGEKRQMFLRVAVWASVLLPIAAFLGSALRLRTGCWWFLVPAQYLVGGVLGVAVAISRGRWWWGLGLWGAILTAFSVLGATVPFWAK
jgi:hypothetical protein